MRSTEEILRQSRAIAVVGLFPNPERDSYQVTLYLKGQGHRVIPVNPNIQEVPGERSYPDLVSVPEKVDIVDIFRRPEHVPSAVEQAIQVAATCVDVVGHRPCRGGSHCQETWLGCGDGYVYFAGT